MLHQKIESNRDYQCPVLSRGEVFPKQSSDVHMALPSGRFARKCSGFFLHGVQSMRSLARFLTPDEYTHVVAWIAMPELPSLAPSFIDIRQSHGAMGSQPSIQGQIQVAWSFKQFQILLLGHFGDVPQQQIPA